MKGLPKTFDTSLFVGRTVDAVSFTVNTVSINFDGGLILTIEGPFEHTAAFGAIGNQLNEPPISESRLMQLAGHQVTEATVVDDGGICLSFEGRQYLRCIRGSEPYECFHISQGGLEVVG